MAPACPNVSMANPAVTGPTEFEMEKPSASQEKVTARSSGVPYAPNTLFIAMCSSMKAVPMSGAET